MKCEGQCPGPPSSKIDSLQPWSFGCSGSGSGDEAVMEVFTGSDALGTGATNSFESGEPIGDATVVDTFVGGDVADEDEEWAIQASKIGEHGPKFGVPRVKYCQDLAADIATHVELLGGARSAVLDWCSPFSGESGAACAAAIRDVASIEAEILDASLKYAQLCLFL